MLLHQDKNKQDEIKLTLLKNIAIVIKQYKGPFVFGETISIIDILIAPYFDRMCVLEHYRNFNVPGDMVDFDKWHYWKENLLKHPSMKATRQPKEKLIEFYKSYADATVRNMNYFKYMELYDPEQQLRNEFLGHDIGQDSSYDSDDDSSDELDVPPVD